VADERLIAVFVDFENLALGVKGMKGGFQIGLILKRMLEKGRIVYKRAYCDWGQYRTDVREFHGHGIEMIDIPRSKVGGKNSADIHMVVDALDLCYSKDHIDTFALLTGDSDFSPLASKLKENNKHVIGCGVKRSTSGLLINNCDEFIYYDDLLRTAASSPPARRRKQAAKKTTAKGKAEADSEADTDTSEETEEEPDALDQLMEIVRSLDQESDPPLWGSAIKQTIRRVYPGFNERTSGFKNFADLLKDAQDRDLIVIEYDASRGNYQVRLKEE
jgi:uncharacterized protein (TIGR00288 family)